MRNKMNRASSKSSELVAAEVLISGRVQGVCYRAFTQEAALALGLCGWVRNLPDGQVQAEVEGPKAHVEQLLKSLREGPPHAVVTNVQVNWKRPTGDKRSFMIAR